MSTKPTTNGIKYTACNNSIFYGRILQEHCVHAPVQIIQKNVVNSQNLDPFPIFFGDRGMDSADEGFMHI